MVYNPHSGVGAIVEYEGRERLCDVTSSCMSDTLLLTFEMSRGQSIDMI